MRKDLEGSNPGFFKVATIPRFNRRHKRNLANDTVGEGAAWECKIYHGSYNESYFSNLFDKVLYMFRTCPLSIIRSISTLYTRNRYLSC